jgi:uncharacterized protein (DUF885 family)
MSKHIREIFEAVKNKNDETIRLDEEYNIGEAAKALHETRKIVKAMDEFLGGEFATAFKSMHMDPRNIEDGVSELQGKLERYKKGLDGQLDQLRDYLDEVHMYLNPQSVNKDTHREDYKRWSRWDRREGDK